MRFSIVIPTRDRPQLFREALASVVAQTCDSFEIIVVDDGSCCDHLPAYEAAFAAARAQIGDRLRTFSLIRRPNGHGPSYALNYGVAQASGEYVGFLDDDDIWTATDHLRRAATACEGDVDVYFSNQSAAILGQEIAEPLWLGGLARTLAENGHSCDANGHYRVHRAQLIAHPGFSHLNCTVVRRAFFDQIGGLDETIRWEGDRDFYLRLIDSANTMIYNPRQIGRHNIPDQTKTANMTTSINTLQKRLSQLRVVDKAAILAQHDDIRAHGRLHRFYTLQKVAKDLHDAADFRGAAHFARAAFGARPTLGAFWFANIYTLHALSRPNILSAVSTT